MSGAYSLDFRKKVLEFIEKGGQKREASRVFGIGDDTIYRWLKLQRNGNLEAKKRTQGPMKVDPVALAAYVKENNDQTLDEIAQALTLGRKTVWTWLRRLNITRKKRPRCIKSATKTSEENFEKR